MFSGIDPKVDYAFKRLFGSERNSNVLIHFLNAVLQSPRGEEVTDVVLLDPFNPQDVEDDKLSILDVKARDQSGRLFDVEMQMVADRALPKRILYYWAEMYRRQIELGDDYQELRPAISICISATNVFPNVGAFHSRFLLHNPDNGQVFSNDLRVHTIELNKFRLVPEQLGVPLELWAYFLKHGDKLDPKALPPTMDRAEFRQALEELAMIAQTDFERERYEARIKFERDQRSRLRAAKDEGREEGLERGLEKGLEKGREQGVLAGRIQLCQQLLGEPISSLEDLAAEPLAVLNQQLESLLARLAPRP